MPLLSRAERSRGRPRPSSPSHPQQARRAARLPDYEPLSFPLGTASRRELAELSNNTDTRKYERATEAIHHTADQQCARHQRPVREEEARAGQVEKATKGPKRRCRRGPGGQKTWPCRGRSSYASTRGSARAHGGVRECCARGHRSPRRA